ncbi:MAG: hypothetical protein WCR67_05615, partial [Bacilli bacterium]
TVIMSSNTIEELEKTCDRVMMISQGKLVDIASLEEIRNRKLRDYKIGFECFEDYQKFLSGRTDILKKRDEINQVIVRVKEDELNSFFIQLSHLSVSYLSQIPYSLKNYFDERS